MSSVLPPPACPLPPDASVVVLVAYPGMGLLDYSGPLSVFWAASRYARERGQPGYACHAASIDGGPVATAEGVAIHTAALREFEPVPLHTVIVPGGPEIVDAVAASPALVRWLRLAAPRARRMASVCTGAFLLAEAGLLEGKRAATHWAMQDAFRSRFGAVTLDEQAVYVRQGSIWTSAGVTTGIDLALALVEADCGADIARLVARELAVFLRRPGGQPQISTMLLAQEGARPAFDALHLWIADNIGRERLAVEDLAAQVGMSPRNFARVYRQRQGRTPAKAVEAFRVEAARRLLETSERTIDQIARDCGFGTEDRMRQSFQRQVGVSPSRYRVQRTA
ncbi:DJ-1/PfpI family protein [Cupriavidus respiraculi]|uniref:GlxA family transcriptional regulator n=1 Tax=Cupriavidus respiraculi TaxID=195930 RepID=UPI001C96B0DF|nr:DJ-1/PfpI family protein [Cupriavidus respiraculi]MBY4948003.1 DJ-1/PfpI family protein [Cupriavidus respiraculi]